MYFGTIAKEESRIASRLRQPGEAETRAKSRRDAEVARMEVELKPCQNIDGYVLSFKPAASKQP